MYYHYYYYYYANNNGDERFIPAFENRKIKIGTTLYRMYISSLCLALIYSVRGVGRCIIIVIILLFHPSDEAPAVYIKLRCIGSRVWDAP